MAKHRTHSATIWARNQCEGASRSPPWRLSHDFQNVNCRVCLYQLGLYVPLPKLREHQAQLQAEEMARTMGLIRSDTWKPY